MKPACFDRRVVFRHFGGNEVNVHIGAIGSFELRKAQHPLAVGQLMNGGSAFRLVREPAEFPFDQYRRLGPLRDCGLLRR